jgi:membrane associated rhomboid family serine protease
MSWSTSSYGGNRYGTSPYGSASPPGQPGRTRMRPLNAALLILGLLALMWVLELWDQSTGGWLDQFGIHARELDGLPGIFSAPMLHAGMGHLISNTVPFAVLGFLTAIGGFVRWIGTTLVAVIVSGLTAWLLTPMNTIVIGASGVIFGWLTYLIARGAFDRRPAQIIIAVLVLLFYGGLIWGVLPTQAGVSWQAHLGGAIGGVLAAKMLHGRRQARQV